MLQIDLTKEEQAILKELLEYDLKETINEISNTENWKFKEGLKAREVLIKKLLGVL